MGKGRQWKGMEELKKRGQDWREGKVPPLIWNRKYATAGGRTNVFDRSSDACEEDSKAETSTSGVELGCDEVEPGSRHRVLRVGRRETLQRTFLFVTEW